MEAGTIRLENTGRLALREPTSVSTLLGREVRDELTLTLGRAPAFVFRSNFEGAKAGYGLVIDEALGRRGLMDLLYTVAPYKAHGPDRFARVLDNWGIFDRAKTSSASENLFLQHANALKLSWQEFGRHRDLFVSIFEDQSEKTRALPVLSWEKSADGVRQWRFGPFDEALIQALEPCVGALTPTCGQAPQPDTLVGLVSLPYLLPHLRRTWPAWRPLVKDGKSNYIGPASVPVMALMHRRALLNCALISEAEAYADEALS